MSTPANRVTFSPGEFAALFGKSQTWGYRQIYAGKIRTITEYGRILIPASEVEKILKSASRYEGMPKKAPQTKEEIRVLQPKLQTAWREFITRKRGGSKPPAQKPQAAPKPARSDPRVRKAALARLTGRKASR